MERINIILASQINIPIFSPHGIQPIGLASAIFPIVIFLDTVDKDYFTEDGGPPADEDPFAAFQSLPEIPRIDYDPYYYDYYDYSDGSSYSSPYSSSYFSSSSPSWGNTRIKRGLDSMAAPHNLPALVLGKTRSLAQDQLAIFKHLETSMSVSGVNGHMCLLRAVCEAQSKRILTLNLLGHLLSAFLTPQDQTILRPYWEAAELGRSGVRDGQCSKHYPGCPVSLLQVFSIARKKALAGIKKNSTKSRIYPNIG